MWLAAGESTGAAGAVTVATVATVSDFRARERAGTEDYETGMPLQ